MLFDKPIDEFAAESGQGVEKASSEEPHTGQWSLSRPPLVAFVLTSGQPALSLPLPLPLTVAAIQANHSLAVVDVAVSAVVASAALHFAGSWTP